MIKVTDAELQEGYPCDYIASSLPIVAKKGILICLTRNLDKRRGFVNGALAVVWEQLDGNRAAAGIWYWSTL